MENNPESNFKQEQEAEKGGSVSKKKRRNSHILAWLLARLRRKQAEPQQPKPAQVERGADSKPSAVETDVIEADMPWRQPLRLRWQRIKERVREWLGASETATQKIENDEVDENTQDGFEPSQVQTDKPEVDKETPEDKAGLKDETELTERPNPPRPEPERDVGGVDVYTIDDRYGKKQFVGGFLLGGLSVGLWQRHKRKKLERKLNHTIADQKRDIDKLKSMTQTEPKHAQPAPVLKAKPGAPIEKRALKRPAAQPITRRAEAIVSTGAVAIAAERVGAYAAHMPGQTMSPSELIHDELEEPRRIIKKRLDSEPAIEPKPHRLMEETPATESIEPKHTPSETVNDKTAEKEARHTPAPEQDKAETTPEQRKVKKLHLVGQEVGVPSAKPDAKTAPTSAKTEQLVDEMLNSIKTKKKSKHHQAVPTIVIVIVAWAILLLLIWQWILN